MPEKIDGGLRLTEFPVPPLWQASRVTQEVSEGAIYRNLGLVQPAAFLWFLGDGESDVTKHAERAWKIFSQAICCEEVHEQCEQVARRVGQ